jgi:ankyrin repeat protein
MPSILSLWNVDEPVFRTWYTIYQRVSMNHVPWKMTSLNIAAEFEFPNVLASLLENGGDPNEPGGHGATPLARSVRKSKSKRAVELLLDANADAHGWEEPWYNELDESGSEVEVKPFAGRYPSGHSCSWRRSRNGGIFHQT